LSFKFQALEQSVSNINSTGSTCTTIMVQNKFNFNRLEFVWLKVRNR